MLLFLSSATFAQVGINYDNSAPDSSAGLDVKSINWGFLPPRMSTSQRDAIPLPAAGLVIFNTDENAVNFFNGTNWKQMIPDDACSPVLLDTRDGKLYPTVQIGAQCWMAQNMNIGIRIGGTTQTNNGIFEKYCYSDLESNCNIYGGLYQWDEAMQYVTTLGVQGICPLGWHLPSDADWITLTTFLGGTSAAGGKMKETGTTHWASPNTGATNSSGFTALPGGYRGSYGSFANLMNNAFFWTSVEVPTEYAWYRKLFDNAANVYRYYDWKDIGYSGRCLKD